MSARRPGWGTAARITLCGLLLGFAFHSIFLNEGRLAWIAGGRAWDGLSLIEQWRVAWTEGPRALWGTLLILRPADGLWSLVFMGLTIVLGLLRWHLFLAGQGLGLPLGRTAEISFVAHFFNSLLLGSAGGDVMKAYYAARETHHKKAEAVMTVVVDRLIGLFATLFFAAVLMAPNRDLLAAHHRLAAVSGFVLSALLVVTLVTVLSLWGGLGRVWPRLRGWVGRLPKAQLIERSLEATRNYGRKPGILGGALALSLMLNAACCLQIWSLARGLGIAVPLRWLMLIVPIVIFLSSIPITPNGLGVRENLYVWMLTVPEIGVPATSALTLSLLAFGGSLLWSLVGGIVYVGFRRKHRLGDVLHHAAESPVE
ncbi:MAG: flippase-like domain-containing protein [Verrucomicrobiales bacterium]|nr:flippase-like domain-containing protein [Verrucomicrobiales bacterium]